MKLILYVILFASFVSYSQPVAGGVNTINGGASQVTIYTRKGFVNKDGVYRGANESHSIKGSKLLFETFDNKGVLINNENKKFSLKNINVDLVDKSFVSKISNDTLFYFKNVKTALINNIQFEQIGSDIYKNLFKGKKIALYILNSVVLRDEVIDKLSYKVIEPKRWMKNEKLFYALVNKDLIELKLNKKSVLAIFSSEDAKLIKSHAKEKGLSFRKKDDVVKLLSYYDKN